jgi:hypothetical protein
MQQLEQPEAYMNTITRREFIRLTAAAGCICMAGCGSQSSKTGGAATAGYDARKLMDDFNDWLVVSGSAVVDLLGSERGSIALDSIRTDFEGIIPGIPWIGGDSNPNTFNLLGSAYSMALIKPLQAQRVPARDIGHTIYLMAQSSFRADSAKLQRQGAQMLTAQTIAYMREGAQWSQKRVYEADFVFDFVEPKDGSVYGINMIECAIQKFYRQQNQDEYVRYNCLVDYPLYQTMNVHLDRSGTLGNGADNCDFRYLPTGSTPDGWPPEERPEFKGDPS